MYNAFSPFSVLSSFAPFLVLAFCIIIFYDFVALSLIVRFLLNHQAVKKAELVVQRKSGIAGIFQLVWRSLKFQYWENLNHKTWLSPSLKWHIRLFRMMFYVISLLAVLLVVGFAFFYANSLSELYNFQY